MLSTIFSPISASPGSRSAASAAATRVTGSGDSISCVVNGMTEEVTTFRVRFTLASGTLFRKRFLGSARPWRAGCGALLRAEFASGQHYKSSRWQKAIASTLQACARQKALALGAKHDLTTCPYAKKN